MRGRGVVGHLNESVLGERQIPEVAMTVVVNGDNQCPRTLRGFAQSRQTVDRMPGSPTANRTRLVFTSRAERVTESAVGLNCEKSRFVALHVDRGKDSRISGVSNRSTPTTRAYRRPYPHPGQPGDARTRVCFPATPGAIKGLQRFGAPARSATHRHEGRRISPICSSGLQVLSARRAESSAVLAAQPNAPTSSLDPCQIRLHRRSDPGAWPASTSRAPAPGGPSAGAVARSGHTPGGQPSKRR
jgi:hypothetical protein